MTIARALCLLSATSLFVLTTVEGAVLRGEHLPKLTYFTGLETAEDLSEQRLHPETELSPEEEAELEAQAPAKVSPHLQTFGGETFDFHGACDLVLLHNPTFHNGIGMDIHIRTKTQAWWSYMETAALRIGEEYFEVMGGSNRTQWLWVNGKVRDQLTNGEWYESDISGYKVRYRQKSSNREAHIYLGDGEMIVLKTYKEFVKVSLGHKVQSDYAGAMGLMGRFPDGAMLGRDQVTEIHNANEYGQEWQVLPSEPKLFHTYEGAIQSPQQCKMPSARTTSLRRRGLKEPSVSKEDAEKACRHIENDADRKACVDDVMANVCGSMHGYGYGFM